MGFIYSYELSGEFPSVIIYSMYGLLLDVFVWNWYCSLSFGLKIMNIYVLTLYMPVKYDIHAHSVFPYILIGKILILVHVVLMWIL